MPRNLPKNILLRTFPFQPPDLRRDFLQFFPLREGIEKGFVGVGQGLQRRTARKGEFVAFELQDGSDAVGKLSLMR